MPTVLANRHRSFRKRRSGERHRPMDKVIVLCSTPIILRGECM
ncbi:MAG: hypothetical protein JWL61_4192 [Gemmatimonadetes bacterium]|nr:hypothetical protein [Gemmatimonadota bacterium]